ncbi:MAG: hypothetical protein ACRD3W_14310, partial [Terriglobales bacterium]
NTPVPPPIDTSTWVYECTATVKCTVGPLINLSFVPWIGLIPGLGKPAIICLSASRAAEYPRGLAGKGNLLRSDLWVPALDPNPSVPPRNGIDDSGWNYPDIYRVIKRAGQTIVDQDVLQVPAKDANWTGTTIVVQPGEKLWIDLRSTGQWTTWTGVRPLTDANGATFLPPDGPAPNVPEGTLVAKVGTGPAFKVGTSFMNYAPGQSGKVQLIDNDQANAYNDNSGVQTVRIILTR